MNNISVGGFGLPKLVVIGGGATGTGIAVEASRRGFEVLLIERGELGSGTSSHFHGILHSGARYAVSSLEVAAECYQENQRLRHAMPSAVIDTGGLFVALTDEEARHADTVLAALDKAAIPYKEITTKQALMAEPHLSGAVKRAFTVPDGYVDGAELIRLNRRAAELAEVPVTFMTHHTVTALHKNNGKISAISIKDARTGEESHIECDYVINAAGVWTGHVSALAGIEVNMTFDKGTMIVFQERFTKAVINRCRSEDDGDLLVPNGNHSVMGTTARVIDDPDACWPTQEEVDVLLREGMAMVPDMAHGIALRVYAGVRPLFRSGEVTPGATTRSINRSFRVIDHEEQGVGNFISIVGGKVTTYRRMAEATVDVLCQKQGGFAPRISAEVAHAV